ncbi:MAG TPA: hypothetical protein VHY20_10160, partial [Pirellulales bacterium]|nr:hypothetical protein [Pirellulales bacterium]
MASAKIWRQVIPRMRGADISIGDHLDRLLDGTEDCQAVAISRAAAPRPAIAERLLIQGKHVLLVDLPCWQADEMLSLLQ